MKMSKQVGVRLSLAVFAAVLAVGCTGDPGNVYGTLELDPPPAAEYYYIENWNNSGFDVHPDDAIARDHRLNDGSYSFRYGYWRSNQDGDAEAVTSLYGVFYTVKAEEGGFLSDGDDINFRIVLREFGPDVIGLSALVDNGSREERRIEGFVGRHKVTLEWEVVDEHPELPDDAEVYRVPGR